MKTTVRVDGLLDLDKALQELATKATARNVIKRALNAAAQPIYQDMQAGAPNESIRDSIEVSDKLTKRQAAQARKMGRAGVELFVGASYKIGTRGRLAHLFEFGTRGRYQKTTGRYTGAISTQPFVRPAWDANQGNALSILKEQMWAEITKATERARRKAERDARKAAQS
jgi:HK97 gp10 family phage protein